MSTPNFQITTQNEIQTDYNPPKAEESQGEYSAFVDLTRRLLSVSKEEVDSERAKH